MDNKFILNGKEYNGNDSSGEVFGLFERKNETLTGEHCRLMKKVRRAQAVGSIITIIVSVGCIVIDICGWVFYSHSTKAGLTALLVAAIFYLIGFALTGNSISQMKKKISVCNKEVRGTVAGYTVNDQDHSSARSFTAEFEYLYNNTTYKLQSKYSSYKRPTVGERVIIFIDPAAPSNAYEPRSAVNTIRTMVYLGNMMIIMGTVMYFIILLY